MLVEKSKYSQGYRDTQRFLEDCEDAILFKLANVSVKVVLAQPGMGKTSLTKMVPESATKCTIDWDKIQTDVKVALGVSGWDIIRFMNDDYDIEVNNSNRILSTYGRGYNSKLLNLHASALLPYLKSVALLPAEDGCNELVILAYHPIQLLIISMAWRLLGELFYLRGDDRYKEIKVDFFSFKSHTDSIKRWKHRQNDVTMKKGAIISDDELKDGFSKLKLYYRKLADLTYFFFEEENRVKFVVGDHIEVTDGFLSDYLVK